MRKRILSLVAVLSMIATATPASAQYYASQGFYSDPSCGRFLCDGSGRSMGTPGTGVRGGYVIDNGRAYLPYYGSDFYGSYRYGTQPPRAPRAGYYSPYGSSPSEGSTGDWYVRSEDGVVRKASSMPPPDRPKPRSGAEWGCMHDSRGGWKDCDWYYSGRDRSTLIALGTFVAVVATAVVLANNTDHHRRY